MASVDTTFTRRKILRDELIGLYGVVERNLYLTTRMIFSLARGGYAPAALGKLSRHGTPVHALLVSSAGMFAALLLEHFLQQSTYLYMLGAAFFGGLFVWMMIFVTHLAFRRRHAQDMASPGAASGAPCV